MARKSRRPRGRARAKDVDSPQRSNASSNKSRPRLTPAAKATILGVAIVVALAASYLFLVYPREHGPGDGRDVELTFEGDESPDAIAARLTSAGLIATPRLFSVYVRLTNVRAVRGAHLLTDDLSPGEIAHRLARSVFATHQKVTIPEGYNRFDIAKRLQALHVASSKAFLDASIDRTLLDAARIKGDSFEGYLFPATYDFASDSDPSDVVRRMKAEFDKRYATIEARYGAGALDLAQSLHFGMNEVVILASMVEKETGAPDDRPLVASVFLNRLRDPSFESRVLQSDPTAAYGCILMRDKIHTCASYAGKVTHDINMDPTNPYSTYPPHKGLPPGPIANPGARSLEAVINAPATKYFYFVARGDGHSTFSETYDAHVSAIKHAAPP